MHDNKYTRTYTRTRTCTDSPVEGVKRRLTSFLSTMWHLCSGYDHINVPMDCV